QLPGSRALRGHGLLPAEGHLRPCRPRERDLLRRWHPDPQLFDLGALTETYDWVLTHHGVRALQYGVSEGETELREQAARRLCRSLPTDASQIQVTSGSQEGLFVIAQAMLEPGDVVLVESPTYLAAVQAFSVHGAR